MNHLMSIIKHYESVKWKLYNKDMELLLSLLKVSQIFLFGRKHKTIQNENYNLLNHII